MKGATNMKNNIIRIGAIWNLGDLYKDDYKYAIVTYDLDTKETIVELWSNWNTSYNKTDRIKHADPLDAIKPYTKTKQPEGART